MRTRKIRSLICVILSILLIMTNMVYGDTVKADVAKCPDIVGNKYEAQLRRWVDNGFIKGAPDGNFKPYDRVTRAEFMAMVNRAFGFADMAEPSFSDVKNTDWFFEDVRKAVKNGYMVGSNGKMRPMSNISRQEFAIVLARLAKYDTKVDDGLLDGLMDKDSIPAWSKGAVCAAYSKGLFKDFVYGLFKPMENISRLEVVVVLDRLLVQMGLLVEEPIKIMPSMPGLTVSINGLYRIDNTHFSSTVTKGSAFTLPTAASFRMPDGTTQTRDITWTPKTINTSSVGTYTAAGTIPGYGTVTLTLTVSAPSGSRGGGSSGSGGSTTPAKVHSTYVFLKPEDLSGIRATVAKTLPVGIKAASIKDLGYDKVRFNISVAKPEGAEVELLATDTNGVEHDVAEIGYWGPAEGFPISKDYEATTNFTGIFSEAGEYTIAFELKDLAGNKVIASDSINLTVLAYNHMEIEYRVPEFTAGVPDTFTVRTIPNDDEGKMVRAYFTLPDGVVVEYREAVPAGTGIIQGAVQIWEGEDNSGITVTAKGYLGEGNAIELSTVTNADGSFSIEGLPTGSFVVQAAKEGYFSSARLVRATDGEIVVLDRPIILYLLENAGFIEGYARYIDRDDHRGIIIRIQTPEGEELPDLIAMTDENGFFRFDAVPTLPEVQPQLMMAAVLDAAGGTTYILTASALNDSLRLATDSVSVIVYPNQTSVLPEDSNLWLRPAAQSAIIFADDETPWDSNALSDMLGELGVDYHIYRSSDMSSVELSLDSIVWIINDQPQAFYDAYAANQQKFDDFVRNGGTLLFEACDMGWNGGSILGAGAALPGGVNNKFLCCGTNTVINPTHPMMEGVKINLSGKFASHNYFIDFPDVSTLLCVDEYNNPTLVEYKYGQGRVIATGQPLEYHWAYDQDPKNIYPNMIYYTFNLPIPTPAEAQVLMPMKTMTEAAPRSSGNAEAIEKQQNMGVKKLQLAADVEQENGNDGWIPLNGVFGPEEGFPLSDITTTFRAIFDNVGEYNVNVEFRTVEDNEVLGSKDIVANVVAAPVPEVTSGEMEYTDNHDGSGTFIVTVKDQFGNKMPGLTANDFVVSLRGQNYVVGQTSTMAFTALEDGTYRIVFNAGIAIDEVVDLIVKGVTIVNDEHVVISVTPEVTSGEMEYTDNHDGSGTFIVTVKDQFGNKMPGLTANDFVVSLRGQNYVVGQTSTMAFTALEDGTYRIVFNAGIAIDEVVDLIVKGILIVDDMQVVISVPKVPEHSIYEFVKPTDLSGIQATVAKTLPVGIRASEVKDLGYDKVRFNISITDKPEGAEVELLATDSNSVEYDVAEIGYWGPAEGFAISKDYEATTDFTGTFSQTGSYTIEFELYDIEASTAIVRDSVTVIVQPAPAAMEISAEVPDFIAGEQKEFTVSTVANDDAGKLVRAYFTLPVEADVEYEEDGSWYTLGSVYGPAEGFPVAAATSRFRAIFGAEGTYTVTVEFKTVDDDTVLASKDITVIVEPAPAAMEISAEVPDFIAGEQKEFTVSTVANDDVGKLVRAYFTLPVEADVEYEEDGSWYTLVDVYGPAEGFPVAAATSRFRAIFGAEGTYTVTVEFKTVDDDTILASKDITVIVEPAPAAMEISAEVPDFIAGEQKEFTVSTVANDDAGKLVRAYFTLPVEADVEYEEDGSWYTLVDVYGPAEGFPVAAATSRFRAIFGAEGTYTVTVEFKTVDDDTVLASKDITVIVEPAQVPELE